MPNLDYLFLIHPVWHISEDGFLLGPGHPEPTFLMCRDDHV